MGVLRLMLLISCQLAHIAASSSSGLGHLDRVTCTQTPIAWIDTVYFILRLSRMFYQQTRTGQPLRYGRWHLLKICRRWALIWFSYRWCLWLREQRILEYHNGQTGVTTQLSQQIGQNQQLRCHPTYLCGGITNFKVSNLDAWSSSYAYVPIL